MDNETHTTLPLFGGLIPLYIALYDDVIARTESNLQTSMGMLTACTMKKNPGKIMVVWMIIPLGLSSGFCQM